MRSNQPSKEDLSAFIYLADQMLATDFNSEAAETGNIYEIIATEGSGINGETIHARTIRRAFDFRKNLKAGKVLYRGCGMPQIKTLNTLTYFYFDKQAPTRFKTFKRAYKKEIEKYCEQNYPSDEILKLIFKPNPPKINFIDKKERDLKQLLDLTKEKEFENLKKELFEINRRFETFQKKVDNDFKLQNDMIKHLKKEIIRVKKERKRASFFYRFFGAIGLFFVSIDYNEITIKNVLNSFMDEYGGLDGDDILEDMI